MSLESAKAFMERMKTDEDFMKNVMKCKDKESRIQFVNAAGFNFSADEINMELQSLSDDEIDSVVGGRWKCRNCVIDWSCLFDFGPKTA